MEKNYNSVAVTIKTIRVGQAYGPLHPSIDQLSNLNLLIIMLFIKLAQLSMTTIWCLSHY